MLSERSTITPLPPTNAAVRGVNVIPRSVIMAVVTAVTTAVIRAVITDTVCYQAQILPVI